MGPLWGFFSFTFVAASLLRTQCYAACIAAPPGIVAWWPGESNTLDIVGTNNGTAYNGVTYTQGMVSLSFNLNGTGAHVRIPDSPSLHFTNGLTIEGWIFPLDNTAYHDIFSKWDAVSGPEQRSYATGILPDGTLGFTLCPHGTTVTSLLQSTNKIPTNTWTHFAGTYDGSSMKIYINGVMQKQVAYNQGIFQSTDAIGLGATVGGASPGQYISPFKGKIDELTVYNRGLSAAEIEGIFASGAGGKCLMGCQPPAGGLVSLWRAEGNANDSVDGNNGTLKNGASFATGQIGSAFNFFAVSNQYVEIPNSANLNPSTSFSWEGWVYPRADADQTIVAKWGDDGDEFNNRSYSLLLEPGRILRFGITDYNNQFNPSLHLFDSPPNSITLNSWNHVAVTYEQSTGTRRIFVNGAKVAERSDGPLIIYSGTAKVGIGATIYTSTSAREFLNGMIDELSYYSRALSTNEILAIYNAGATGKCQPTNRPPVATNMVAATIQGRPITIPTPKFLLSSFDPDGDPLTLTSVSPTSTNGAPVALTPQGVTYSAGNAVGSDQFTYTVDDGNGGTASAFVFVQVRSTNTVSGNMFAPVPSGGGFQVSFAGIPGYTYTLQRAPTPTGAWSTIGTVLVGPNGIGSFFDPNPPAGSAFYRTVYP
jgi:hypothetical protein